jgi:putative tricarboxylic transport membrane protein
VLRVRDPSEFVAGVLVLGLALAIVWSSWDLPVGEWRRPGPGAFPQIIVIILLPLGAGMLVRSFIVAGEAAEFHNLRRVCLPVLGLLLFALTLEPFGLLVAVPLLVVVSSLADPNFRLVESVLYGFAMAGFVVAVFVGLLDLPMKVLPW